MINIFDFLDDSRFDVGLVIMNMDVYDVYSRPMGDHGDCALFVIRLGYRKREKSRKTVTNI